MGFFNIFGIFPEKIGNFFFIETLLLFSIQNRTKPGTALIETALTGDPLYFDQIFTDFEGKNFS